jgi:hypothetical protein
MNLTNTYNVNKFNSMNFPTSMNFPFIGSGIPPSFEKWQVNEQVFWQVVYQFNPIRYKIKQEIKK